MGAKGKTNKKDSNTITIVGLNIRKYRKIKGISQVELAFMSELSPNQIGQYERGEVDPNVTSLKIICDILEIHPGLLFDK